MVDEEKSFHNIHAKIVARAWSDAAFKERLKVDPISVLREYGLEMPKEIKLHVVEETEKDRYFIIPISPNLTEEDLKRTVGGAKSFSIDVFFG